MTLGGYPDSGSGYDSWAGCGTISALAVIRAENDTRFTKKGTSMSSNKSTSPVYGLTGTSPRSIGDSRGTSGARRASGGTSFVMGSRKVSRGKDPQAWEGSYAHGDGDEFGRRKVKRGEARERGLLNRGVLVQGVSSVVGGDKNSLPLERYVITIVLFGGLVLLAFAIRWVAHDSDQDNWISERRAVVEYR